jgi:hypothetical protein
MAASIRVRYLGPTDNKGARHVVSCVPYRSLTVGYDHALSHAESELAAVFTFITENPALAGEYVRVQIASIYDVLYVNVADAIDFQP